MIRWLFGLTLLAVGPTAQAQPAPSSPAQSASSSPAQSAPPSQRAASTERAERTTRELASRVERLAVKREELATRYQRELAAIDRLKQQRASWRRDRELRDSLSSSLETANQLSHTTRQLERARARLVRSRRNYLAIIESELASGVLPVRKLQLERAMGQVSPLVEDTPRRIVLPDLEIDPLADPEELEQRAAELRASEEALTRHSIGLASQAAELDRLAQLRAQHERAGDLLSREDAQPHRTAPRKPSGVVEEVGGGDPGRLPNVPGGAPSPPETYVPIVLADVIDASTIDSLAAALRSGDPAQRAQAAHRAHAAVARRLEQLRQKRAEIEARATLLRAKR